MASFYIPEEFNNIQLKNRCIPKFVIIKFNVDPRLALSNRLPNLDCLTHLVSSADNLLAKLLTQIRHDKTSDLTWIKMFDTPVKFLKDVF